MATKLVFLRHGAVTGAEGRCIGHTDLPLSEAGASEIEAVAHAEIRIRNASRVAPVTHIICSDLQRATQSAFILSRELGVEFTMDARLREMNFGEWDGISWSELESRDGERLSNWMQQWQTESAPGGETVAEMSARVVACVRDLTAQIDRTARTIVVVAHAGSIRLALCHLLQMLHANMFDIEVDHAHAHVVDLLAEGPTRSGINVRALR